MEPAAPLPGDDALGPEHGPVLPAVQGGQYPLQPLLRKGAGGLHPPAGKDLVRVVAVVVMAVVMMVLMLVLMLMVMLMLMLMVMVMVMLVIVVMLVVVPVAAAVVVVVVLSADGADLLLVQQLLGQGVAVLHGGEELRPGEVVPGGSDNGGRGVLLPQQGNRLLQLPGGELLGAAEDNGPGVLDLVGVEFAEVLQVDPALGGVGHRDGTAQNHLRHRLRHALDRPDHVGELAHAGGLDEDAVRVELVHHLFQGLAEVPHQGAADAPGVHLRNLNARVLQKAAVNADLAKLVLNEHQLLALQGLVQQFFDERGLASA